MFKVGEGEGGVDVQIAWTDSEKQKQVVSLKGCTGGVISAESPTLEVVTMGRGSVFGFVWGSERDVSVALIALLRRLMQGLGPEIVRASLQIALDTFEFSDAEMEARARRAKESR